MKADNTRLTINLCYTWEKLNNQRHGCVQQKVRQRKPIFLETQMQTLVFIIHDSNRDMSNVSVSSLCLCPPSIQLVKGSTM